MRRSIPAIGMGISLLCMAILLAPSAGAVEPDEILANPALETRARALSRELRCMVCQNESIDDSHAPLARDLRLIVRERLVAGESDAAVLAFLTDRYGEFVLLRPRFNLTNLLLWLAPLVVFVFGAGLSFYALRRRQAATASPIAPLDEKEQETLRQILQQNARALPKINPPDRSA